MSDHQLVAELRAMMDDVPARPRSLIHFHWAVPPGQRPVRQWMTDGSVVLWCPQWIFYRLPRGKPKPPPNPSSIMRDGGGGIPIIITDRPLKVEEIFRGQA